MSPIKTITAGLICLAILAGGVLIYLHYKKPPVIAEVSKGIKKTRKVTPQKGLPPIIEETEEVIESNKTTPVPKKNSLSIGGSTNLKAAIQLEIGNQQHEILTDGNKDHVYIFKYKVLEF